MANRLVTLLSHANERGKYGYDNLTKKMERFGNRVTTRAVLKPVVGFFHHDNGQIMREGNYKDGTKDGHWVGYHDNGQLW